MDLLPFLIKKKIINQGQAAVLKSKLEKAGVSLEELLLMEKIIGEGELFKLKSEILKVPLKEEVSENIPREVISLIPKESVEFYKMVPLSLNKGKGILEVGMVFPEDSRAQEALKFLARQEKLSLKIFLITFSTFKNYFNRYQAPEKEMEKALETLEEELEKEKKKGVPEELETVQLTEEAPIIKMVAVILREAVEGRASDIHIEPTRENLKVRYRMDGILYPSLFLPLKVHPAIVARIKILSNLKIDETRMPQDGRFSATISGKKIDFRVSTFPTSLGEKVAMRVLDPEEGLKSLTDLGLREKNFQLIKEGLEKNFGMILATGPTGSGKTTTLYAILRMLNKESVNIVTLEDPVEYFIPGVNQSQVNPEINYTFARGLRQILRQDPDIIMVGEIRDEETASLAIHAALTGHLVLSTLHTTTAAGVIPRLIDMGIEPFLLPPSLNVMISQRLLRRLCPFCKEKKKLEGEEKKYVLEKLKALPDKIAGEIKAKNEIYVYKAVGCKKCKFKGYAGRVGVYEVIKMTNSLAALINKKPSELEVVREARAQGMISLEEDALLKVLEGVTSLEEIMGTVEEE